VFLMVAILTEIRYNLNLVLISIYFMARYIKTFSIFCQFNEVQKSLMLDLDFVVSSSGM
jgi:hypothetical protein